MTMPFPGTDFPGVALEYLWYFDHIPIDIPNTSWIVIAGGVARIYNIGDGCSGRVGTIPYSSYPIRASTGSYKPAGFVVPVAMAGPTYLSLDYGTNNVVPLVKNPTNRIDGGSMRFSYDVNKYALQSEIATGDFGIEAKVNAVSHPVSGLYTMLASFVTTWATAGPYLTWSESVETFPRRFRLVRIGDEYTYYSDYKGWWYVAGGPTTCGDPVRRITFTPGHSVEKTETWVEIEYIKDVFGAPVLPDCIWAFTDLFNRADNNDINVDAPDPGYVVGGTLRIRDNRCHCVNRLVGQTMFFGSAAVDSAFCASDHLSVYALNWHSYFEMGRTVDGTHRTATLFLSCKSGGGDSVVLGIAHRDNTVGGDTYRVFVTVTDAGVPAIVFDTGYIPGAPPKYDWQLLVDEDAGTISVQYYDWSLPSPYTVDYPGTPIVHDTSDITGTACGFELQGLTDGVFGQWCYTYIDSFYARQYNE